MDDPISHPERIEPYLPHNDDAIVNLFEVAASSFRVEMKVPGSKFFIPDKEQILQMEREQQIKEEKQRQAIAVNNKFIPMPSPEPFEEIPPPKNYRHTETHQKNALKNGDTPEKDQCEPKLVVRCLPDEPATYPPPVPNDLDPVRNKMLHAWYWAGYYAGFYDAQMNSNGKK